MQIGELFILRINIHLNGSVLDTPELFWVEPQLEPVYQAVRSYLEMDQRVGLLTERLDVIADLLAVLKDQLSHGHGEKLEWIGRWHPLLCYVLMLTATSASYHSYRGRDSGCRCKHSCRLICWGGLIWRCNIRIALALPSVGVEHWRGLSVLS